MANLPAFPPPPNPLISLISGIKTKDLKSPLTRKWNPGFLSGIKTRLKVQERIGGKRIREIQKGLTMPDIERVAIGSAKTMVASIMFFDLPDFTRLTSNLGNKNTLFILNLIIPQVMFITKRWGGEIEKNTGDGIMAIFGTETRNDFLIARDTIEAALSIRYVILNEVNPRVTKKYLPILGFRIGIDMENVLIARVGMEGTNFLTVVGNAANRASKLQSYAKPNGICLGENIYSNLHPQLHSYCEPVSHPEWNWVYKGTDRPYRLFHFNANWPEPMEWLRTKNLA